MKLKRNQPMRRCIGCLESKPKMQLCRIVMENGSVRIDISGNADGRGAYICNGRDCFEKAVKRKAFSKTFKQRVFEDNINEIREALYGKE